MLKKVNDSKEHPKIKEPTIAELKAMTPDQLALVPSHIRRKIHLKPAVKGEVRNKAGKNQSLIKRTLELQKIDNVLKTTTDLSQLLPDCVSTLHNIILNSRSDIAKIRAIETVFAYTVELPKSTIKHDHRVSGGTVNAIVYLPADTPINMADVLEVEELDSLPGSGSNDKTDSTE